MTGVQREIDRISQNIQNTYEVLGALGAELPSERTSDNLAVTAGTTKVILYSEQVLTEEQKAQARENIDAQPKGNYLTQHQDISGKLDADKLPEAVEDALAQAKKRGEFDGKDGADGLTPVAGVDYWTQADKDDINNYIATELAKRAQLRPEPAESEEWLRENGDHDKIYVLPDGFLWMYLLKEKSYTNRILRSTDADGNVVGLLEGKRYNSSDILTDQEGANATGFMPVKPGDTVRLRNIQFRNEAINGVTSGSIYLRFYDSYKKLIGSTAAYSDDTYHYFASDHELDAKGNLIRFVLANNAQYAAAEWMRMAFVPVEGKEAIITVNEEIETVREYQWVNTGRAFIPADYEDRIIANEGGIAKNAADIATINERLSKSESEGAESENGLPEYWKAAIDALESTVIEKQHRGGADVFQFEWFSDLHGTYGAANTNGAGTSNQQHIGHIAQYAAERFDIPFVAGSGDIHSQSSHSAVSSVWAEYARIRKLLSPIDLNKLIYTKGNHDGAWGAPVDGVYYLNNIGSKQMYNAIFRRQATDRQRVFGGDGTYFYVDGPQKVRFIMLNSHTDGDGSTNADGSAVYNSMKNAVFGTEQLEWFAAFALDLPDGWGAVVMAHQPLSTIKDGALLAGIIHAYNNGTAYTESVNLENTYWGNGIATAYNTSAVTVDFKGKKGDVIAYFHGHIHKDTIDNTTYSFPCLSITTSSADVRDANPVERVPGTATETALDIVTIDRLHRMIYCTRIGAGHDRETRY